MLCVFVLTLEAGLVFLLLQAPDAHQKVNKNSFLFLSCRQLMDEDLLQRRDSGSAGVKRPLAFRLMRTRDYRIIQGAAADLTPGESHGLFYLTGILPSYVAVSKISD